MSIREKYMARMTWLRLWERAFPGILLIDAQELYARARRYR